MNPNRGLWGARLEAERASNYEVERYRNQWRAANLDFCVTLHCEAVIIKAGEEKEVVLDAGNKRREEV